MIQAIKEYFETKGWESNLFTQFMFSLCMAVVFSVVMYVWAFNECPHAWLWLVETIALVPGGIFELYLIVSIFIYDAPNRNIGEGAYVAFWFPLTYIGIGIVGGTFLCGGYAIITIVISFFWNLIVASQS